MILLVTKAHPSIARLRARYGPGVLGRLVVPKDCARVDETAGLGIPWAADNGAFGEFDEPAFLRMLKSIAFVPDCLFVACPDVVGDAHETLRQYGRWYAEIMFHGLEPALVAQDGLTVDTAPWDEIRVLFIGGTTEWKLGADAAELVAEAKRRGLHVHMGRVNTARRARYAASIGCDSFDGSKFSRFTETYIADGLAWARAGAQERLVR